MSAATIIVIVVVLVILAVAAAAASVAITRRTTERDQFGPEYDRLAKEVGPRKANAEFAKRRQRVDELGITSLSGDKRTAYARRWNAAQEGFIDSPAQAVSAADSLVRGVAAERGYVVTDERFLEDLSVYHGRYLDGYRSARLTIGRAGQATTEARRRALLGYRALFFDLLDAPADGLAPGGRVAADRAALDRAALDRAGANGSDAANQAPGRPAWKQVTQGLHWKTQRQESDDVAETLR
jgi:hypothetical protein